MTNIPEIGEEGFAYYGENLRFGDIIENGYAPERNPNKFGIVVKARGHSINCTDGAGSFWDLFFGPETKIKLHGNTLNENYSEIKRLHDK